MKGWPRPRIIYRSHAAKHRPLLRFHRIKKLLPVNNMSSLGLDSLVSKEDIILITGGNGFIVRVLSTNNLRCIRLTCSANRVPMSPNVFTYSVTKLGSRILRPNHPFPLPSAQNHRSETFAIVNFAFEQLSVQSLFFTLPPLWAVWA